MSTWGSDRRMRISLGLALVVVVAFCAACGGSQPAATASGTPSGTPGAGDGRGPGDGGAPVHEHGGHGGEHAGHGGGEHAGLTPALKDFHEVLAPIWHTTAGAERVAKACGGEKSLRDKATAVNDSELTAASAALGAACAKEPKADVEAKLGAVHDRFHALAKK